MLKSSLRIALSCGAAAACLAWAGPADAQEVDAASNATGVETVIVTATRRAESAQDVAGGITALTGTELDQIHAHDLADFANYVPSLSYSSGGAGNALVTIRGVTTGNNQLGSAIALYMDDVPLGTSTQFGLGYQSFNVNLFDMDRVEVLDGPQGTLYGANALGGAIKYVSAKPDLGGYDARAEAEGSDTEHGSFNDGLRVMANMPLFDGAAAIRVDGLQEFDSGYTQDPDHGRKDVGSGRSLGGRISFLAQITPDLDVRLSAFSQNIHGSGYDETLRNFVTHQPVEGGYDQSFALRQPLDDSLTLYSGAANWDFHWSKLTSITAYQYDHGQTDSDLSALYDFLLSGFGFGTTPFGLPVNTNTRKFTQELRLASPDNQNFEWVLGGYFTRESTDESVRLIDGATPDGKLPIFDVLPFSGRLPSTYRELAIFADGTYYITPDFDVTLGVRYSNQHQTYQSFFTTVLLYPNDTVVQHYQAGSNQGVATYLINPRYRINQDTMIYAKVSSGYRPGGPNFVLPPFFGSPVPPTFRSDTLWNYELGEKSTLLDGKLQLDFDVYDIEWTAIQTPVNLKGIDQLVNAGNARIEGAEGSFDYRVLPDLTLAGSASYMNAYLTTPSALLGVQWSGARLPLSPRYQFALSGTYSFEFGGGYRGALNVSDVYVGDRDSGYNVPPFYLAQGVGSPLYKLGAYNTVNVNLAFFLARNIEVDAYLKNVFDVRGEVSADTVRNDYVNPYYGGPGTAYAAVPVDISLPRTVGLVLKVGLDR